MDDMNEMDNLRFNYTTMPRRKEHPVKEYGNVVTRRISVKNNYGWHNFLFVYGFHFGKHEYAIYVSFVDGDNRVHKSYVSPDHPDFNFLEAYITEI